MLKFSLNLLTAIEIILWIFTTGDVTLKAFIQLSLPCGITNNLQDNVNIFHSFIKVVGESRKLPVVLQVVKMAIAYRRC